MCFELVQITDISGHGHHDGKQAADAKHKKWDWKEHQVGVLGRETPPKHGVSCQRHALSDQEGAVLSECLRHVVDDRYYQEAGEKRRNTAKQCWPVTGCNWIAVIHVVDDDEKCETGDAIIGIEDKEGRRADPLKWLVF